MVIFPRLSGHSYNSIHMWMGRIRCGVLAVRTDRGVRYLRPRLAARLRLMWTFRNFQVLDERVLSRRERSLITRLLREDHWVSSMRGSVESDFMIGTLERATPLPPRKPAQAETTAPAKPALLSDAR